MYKTHSRPKDRGNVVIDQRLVWKFEGKAHEICQHTGLSTYAGNAFFSGQELRMHEAVAFCKELNISLGDILSWKTFEPTTPF